MQPPQIIGKPSARFCFGRDELCEHIVRSALEQGAVLLLGGRQSGKTTLLLRIADVLRSRPDVIPIYVDLMTLPPDTQPSEVFRLLGDLAYEGCLTRDPSMRSSPRPQGALVSAMLGSLVCSLASLIDTMAEPNLRFLFLVDEAKRIVGSRLSKGLEDNLFALLYGDTPTAGRCSIVFAGAQDLYDFCENQTSPIGSRAAFHFVTNLSESDIRTMIQSLGIYDSSDLDRVPPLLQRLAGGHAGLTLRIAVRPENITSDRDYDAILEYEKRRHTGLLRIWASSLSPEARAAQDLLLAKGRIALSEIPLCLQQHGLDRFRSDRASEELQFVGVAIRDIDFLVMSGELYANYARTFVLREGPPPDTEQSAWSSIENTELTLRKIVREKYQRKWGTTIDDQVKKVVGDEAWIKIQENKARGAKSYRYSEPNITDPLLDFIYLGQLAQLIISREAWELFKHLFRDKRQFEDIVADISPVRNDQAHFRRVPDRELVRCKLRCEDLLYLLQQDTDS